MRGPSAVADWRTGAAAQAKGARSSRRATEGISVRCEVMIARGSQVVSDVRVAAATVGRQLQESGGSSSTGDFRVGCALVLHEGLGHERALDPTRDADGAVGRVPAGGGAAGV